MAQPQPSPDIGRKRHLTYLKRMTDLLERGYRWFNVGIAAVLLLGILVVVLLATASFLDLTAQLVLTAPTDVTYVELQGLFDRLLGAVIALELAHSVHLMVSGRRGFAQVRIVLTIGILAVVRKLIVIELETVSGLLMFGLAAAVVALGGTLALLHWLDRRDGVGQDS